MLHIFLTILAPIFALVTAGWCLDRKFRLDLNTLVKLNIYGFVPCFIFVKVLSSPVVGSLALRIVAFTAVIIMSMGLISWLIGKLARLPGPTVQSMQLTTMCYNSGNYGVPLMALAFPGVGEMMQVFVLMTMNVATFSIGTLLVVLGQHRLREAGTEGVAPWRRFLPALRQPSIHAVMFAVLAKYLGWSEAIQESFLWPALDHGAQALVGLALVTLGVQLSQTKPPPLRGLLAWGLIQRLLGGPLLASGLVILFGFQGEMAAVLIVGAGAPTAINTALLAHEFKSDATLATGMVFYTTLLSLLTVGFTLWLMGVG